MKCRLCLCIVDKQLGYSSLLDNGFKDMIQQVLRFAMAPDRTILGQQSSLPVMVCNQCFTTVRNFYGFSKMVETNQKKLRSASTVQKVAISIDELLESIQQKDDSEHDERMNDETLSMSAEAEASGSDSNLNEGIRVPTEIRSTCVDKVDVIDSISRLEERIGVVTANLDRALRTLPILNMVRSDARPPFFDYSATGAVDAGSIPMNNRLTDPRLLSFDFSPIAVEAELESFNNQLADKEYLNLFLSWIDPQTPANRGSEYRLHNAVDLIFSRPFLVECSWTGLSREGKEKRKVALAKYKKVLELFKLIGSARGEYVTNQMVETFLRSKLKRAKHRLNLEGIRKSTCRPLRR